MDSKIVKSTSKGITIQIYIPTNEKDMLSKEELIQMALNEAGKLLATQHILSDYDTDGSPIKAETRKIKIDE
jgi:hypothetical protein